MIDGIRMRGSRIAWTMVIVLALSGLHGCRETSTAETKLASAAQTSAEPTPAAQVPSPAVASAPTSENNGAPGGKDGLIGRTMPPYPDGLAEVQGVCVPGGDPGDDNPEHICDYGIAVLGRQAVNAAPSSVYLIASRNADSKASQPSWIVTDALDSPVTAADASHQLQLGGCRLDGDERGDVVALVRHGQSEYSTDITWAKRLDIASGKFVDVEPSQVDCIDPGYGV
jgi:hypothetical protein